MKGGKLSVANVDTKHAQCKTGENDLSTGKDGERAAKHQADAVFEANGVKSR